MRGGSVDEASGRSVQGGVQWHLQACPELAKESQVSRICGELDRVVDSFL